MLYKLSSGWIQVTEHEIEISMDEVHIDYTRRNIKVLKENTLSSIVLAGEGGGGWGVFVTIWHYGICYDDTFSTVEYAAY